MYFVHVCMCVCVCVCVFYVCGGGGMFVLMEGAHTSSSINNRSVVH